MDLPQRAQRAAKDTKGILTDWLIRGCGALPHTPAGRSSPCTPGTSATCHQDDHRRCRRFRRFRRFRSAPAGEGRRGRPGEQRTENRERSAPVGDKEIAEQRNQTSKPLSFQTSTCPCTPGTSATRHQDDHRRFRRCRRYRSARQAGDRRNRFSGNDRSSRDGHVSEGRRAER